MSAADTVRAAYAAIARGDAIALMNLCRDDVAWELAGADADRSGREAVAEWCLAREPLPETFRFEPTSVREEAKGRVVAVGHLEARAARGRRWTGGERMHVWHVRDGLVARVTESEAPDAPEP